MFVHGIADFVEEIVEELVGILMLVVTEHDVLLADLVNQSPARSAWLSILHCWVSFAGCECDQHRTSPWSDDPSSLLAVHYRTKKVGQTREEIVFHVALHLVVICEQCLTKWLAPARLAMTVLDTGKNTARKILTYHEGAATGHTTKKRMQGSPEQQLEDGISVAGVAEILKTEESFIIGHITERFLHFGAGEAHFGAPCSGLQTMPHRGNKWRI